MALKVGQSSISVWLSYGSSNRSEDDIQRHKQKAKNGGIIPVFVQHCKWGYNECWLTKLLFFFIEMFTCSQLENTCPSASTPSAASHKPRTILFLFGKEFFVSRSQSLLDSCRPQYFNLEAISPSCCRHVKPLPLLTDVLTTRPHVYSHFSFLIQKHKLFLHQHLRDLPET